MSLRKIKLYKITCTKQALWLVNTRVWIRVSKDGNFRKILNNYCGYFIKELPNGFLCLDTLIQTLGMLLDFRKPKKTRLTARVFLRFSQVSQHPACLDRNIPRVWIRVSKDGKPFGISLLSFVKISVVFSHGHLFTIC